MLSPLLFLYKKALTANKTWTNANRARATIIPLATTCRDRSPVHVHLVSQVELKILISFSYITCLLSEGTKCQEEEEEPCMSSPCQNKGVCQNVDRSNYTCFCRPGYDGRNCQHDIGIIMDTLNQTNWDWDWIDRWLPPGPVSQRRYLSRPDRRLPVSMQNRLFRSSMRSRR